MDYRIGIDVGGTNIDAVLIKDNGTIVTSCKVIATKNISEGVLRVLSTLYELHPFDKQRILAVSIGTTHATNAVLQGSELYKVGVIRIAGHKPSLPPAYSWNAQTRSTLYIGEKVINGGYDCDGSCITKLSISEVRSAIYELHNKGAEGFAVVGVFSLLYCEQENIVGNEIKEILGKAFPFTLSHKIGGVGYIERENSAILNTALIKAMNAGFKDLQNILSIFGLTCPLFITQNNGTIITLEEALQYPILTISSGPTNSFVGAARLACKNECVVADIGGTSTDVGIVLNNFPRRSLYNSSIGGITLNCAMPDILSIALGGGSYIEAKDDKVNIGPESAGYLIKQHAKLWGGSKITLTDMAQALGHVNFSSVKFTKQEAMCAKRIMSEIVLKLEKLYQKISGPHADLPFIIVGGGAMLLASPFLPKYAFIPEYAEVANAYGAAFAEVSVTKDTVVSLTDRENVLKNIRNEAKGEISLLYKVNPSSIRIVYEEIIPYHYIPNNLARVRITAASPWIS
ncbi:hydantoinase/oxoprolinase family protein [Wolbachia endosymbiont of Drosophila pseudotakahashii]|uniref:hydantoinase/oxoprolinase family protein n=1 Tax=Wolbachia endosymbiont of Drosophila pseudotakahashii TaxID=375919 RepID=UPI002230F2F8|nr:hydantoinase/oxoprolinase family protein [Wolbachia endosymbiont of Drosophila pseudotakahashii]MCX3064519.1 hydantoinase/oxoprolinase family protein [Wolbachia endosymbiont of Drosophila pseudotakahashii]UZE38000.1 hydantoinase/oxoprolinase family protein [Wolbachia endosymbiont of Drosophila pseudotakahashii]